MSSSDPNRQPLSCSSCSSVMQKHGTTNCWSDPAGRPASPAYCPTTPHGEAIRDAFQEYTGDAGDARLGHDRGQAGRGAGDATVEVTETGSVPKGSPSTR